MCINICINAKGIVLVSIIGGLSYALYNKHLEVKSLTKELEEMKEMKGV